MKKHFLIFLIIISTQLFAGPADTLIKLKDLTFRNETEKIALNNFSANRDKPDYIDLFLASYNNSGEPRSVAIHERIQKYVDEIKSKIEGKAEEKKVKYIYEDVHKTFFKAYKLKNNFNDIFEKGEYNCVSASALYSIIFDMLEIPYQIMESPQHVYVVTYPQTFKILIETTSPEKGYYQFKSNFIEKYVKTLCDSKLIEKSEFEANGADLLFKKYYFSKSGVSLLQLAGIQYSNFAIYNIDDENYEKALPEIITSCFLYPTERNKNILKIALIHIVSNNKYEKPEHIKDLALLCRYKTFNTDEVSNENLRNEFLRVTEAQIIDKSDYVSYNNSYQIILAAVKDSALKNEIVFIYNYELARLSLVNLKELKSEMEHLKAAYKAKPENTNLHSLILSCFARVIEKINEPNFILGIIKDYANKFDFLKSNNRFNSVRANCLLELAFESFSMNEMNKGENYIKDFEILFSSNKEIEPGPTYVEKAYSVPAGIYYKKGNYAKAKQLLKSGLIYAPDSFGLKQRLSQL